MAQGLWGRQGLREAERPPVARLELAGRKDAALQAKSVEFSQKVGTLKTWLASCVLACEEAKELTAETSLDDLRAVAVRVETLSSLGATHLDGIRAASKRVQALLQ